MFGDHFHIRYLENFLKLFDNVRKVLHADISDGIPCLLVFFDPTLVLRARAVTNPFPALPNFPFDSLNKMETTSSESKGKLGRSGKGVGNRYGSQDQSKVEKYKKARYAIVNVSMKDLSNIIKYFEKLSRYLM